MTTKFQSLIGYRVLVVEDDYFAAKQISRFFQNNGAIVIGPVSSLEDAEEYTLKYIFDIAALNINLKGKMVYPVADTLKKKDIPFLFVTGYDASVIPVTYADVPRIQKPCNFPDLLHFLNALVPLKRSAFPAANSLRQDVI